MKKSSIQFQYDTEKLRAIRQYMKDETELQTGLETFLQTLYEQHVPTAVREYIESRDKSARDAAKCSTHPPASAEQGSLDAESEK